MKGKITIQDYLNNFLKYYQKISVSIILGKSKKDSVWYCMNMKILFLRKDDTIDKDFHLRNFINKDNIELRFYDFAIDKFDIVYQALKGKVELNGRSYNFYSNQTSSESDDVLNFPYTIGSFDSNYEDYGGYTFTKCFFSGSFYSMLQDFSLTETDIGIKEDLFPTLLRMDSNYFTSNNLYIIFPLFIKKLYPNNSYLKEYVIDNNLFNDIEIRLYNDKENFRNFIETEKTNNSTLIKIPLNLEKKNITFILNHPKFGAILTLELNNKHMEETINLPKLTENGKEELDIQSKPSYNIFIESVHMGDKIEHIQNSTIINKSLVENSFNKVENAYDKDTRDELEKVAKLIEESKNPAAVTLFDNFTEEINKQSLDKSKLKSIWDNIVKVLPTVSTIATSVEKIFT